VAQCGVRRHPGNDFANQFRPVIYG
jgi:hypothetical protein